MSHLADLLTTLQRTEPGRPRITWYVADGSPADGERVELSGAVLANWASKAANLLQDELDAGPGTAVVLDLPPHWRSLYWALAAWAVGARVGTRGDGEVVVTADPAAAPAGDALVVVTLPALARAAAVPVPAGAVDEARELATYGDLFVPADRAPAGDLALEDPALGYGDADGPCERLLLVVGPADPLSPVLHRATTTLAAGGSVVLVRVAGDGSPERLDTIRAQERVTA